MAKYKEIDFSSLIFDSRNILAASLKNNLRSDNLKIFSRISRYSFSSSMLLVIETFISTKAVETTI